MALAETPHQGGHRFWFQSPFRKRSVVESKDSFLKQPLQSRLGVTQLSETILPSPITQAESFSRFIQTHTGYFQDRPVIMENNANIPSVLQLLSLELDECAEPTIDGKIDTFDASDYRQQELSDVIIFAFSVLQQYDLPLKDVEDHLFSQMENYAKQHLPKNLVFQKNQPWSQYQETFFQQGLSQLAQMQRLVEYLKVTHQGVGSLDRMNREQKDDLWKLMERIMAHSWMLLKMCVADPGLALREKTARNMAKYPVVLKTFNQETLSYDLQVGLPYKEYRNLSRKEWGETKGNQYFYDLPLPLPQASIKPEPKPEKRGPMFLSVPSISPASVVMLR